LQTSSIAGEVDIHGVRILLRAESGFAREDLMAWCEASGIDFLFGLAKNERLIAEITTELDMDDAGNGVSFRSPRRPACFRAESVAIVQPNQGDGLLI
jgi:hypothetical protein